MRLSIGFRNLTSTFHKVRSILIVWSLYIAGSGNLGAQSVPRWEIGPILSSTSLRIGFPSDERATGVGGRVVLNAQQNVAGELQVSGYREVGAINGSGLHAAAHVKLTLRHETSRFNLFTIAGPGYLREETFCCSGHPVYRHWTSLIWDVGGGIEFVPARTLSIRLDFKDVIQTRKPTAVPSGHEHGFDFTIGAMFRFP
jgi:hypothetical protein